MYHVKLNGGGMQPSERAYLDMRERESERRFRVYTKAPGFRPGPRVESRALARGRGVLSTVHYPLPSFLRLRQPLVG